MFYKGRSQGFGTTRFFKSYFILGILGLSVVFFLYFNWITYRLEKETSEFSTMLATFAAQLPSISDKETSDAAKAIIESFKFPFIITNAEGEPKAARRIGDGLREKILANTLTAEDKYKIREIIKKMDKNHRPLSMKGIISGVGDEEGRKILGYLYYDETKYQINSASSIIITDAANNPVMWNNIGEEEGNLVSAAIPKEEVKSFLENAKQKDFRNTIQHNPESEDLYFHYGRTGLIHHIQWWIPLAQITIVTVFLIIGFIGYQRIKANEQQAIWAGLAKETAHQLGTPISSLMGWLDILKERDGYSENKDNASDGDLELASIYKRMQRDVLRLEGITERFGEIGSVPKREPLDIPEIIHQAIDYFRKRLPNRGKHVEIYDIHQNVPKVEANESLLQWVIENLIRNSLDAIDKDNGRIEIKTEYDPKKKNVLITYRDNGRGIPRNKRGKVFLPGYTSKKHGWGLGLAIVKRIIEGYHGGKVKIGDSGAEGTTFLITLPARTK
jgi:signal transduction histidine kinase